MPTPMPRDQFIQVGTVRTRFWQAGDQGPTLVLVHGIGGFVETFAYTVHVLAAHYRVFALDLVGFGKSDKPAIDYSVPMLARFVRQFAEAVGIEQMHLIGHSMGGAVAMQVAMQFPQQVQSLVLVSSAGLGKQAALALRIATLPWLGEYLLRPGRRESTIAGLQSIFLDPQKVTEEMIDISHELAHQPGALASFLATLRSMGTILGGKPSFLNPIRQALGTIHVPVLVIWGRQDPTIPVRYAQMAMTGFRDVRLHLFEQCGHLPQLEYPEQFNRLVGEFLTGKG